MPRLKLITLPWELEVPTLTLASLAAVTPPAFEIAIVDLLRERLVLDEAVDLVGITASTPKIKAAYVLADLYRSLGVTVVMGGPGITSLRSPRRRSTIATLWSAGKARRLGAASATTS